MLAAPSPISRQRYATRLSLAVTAAGRVIGLSDPGWFTNRLPESEFGELPSRCRNR
ncbi:hypothetical protein IU498_33730 [Nocardia beijingensis]|nr:hypothetical protein [Nocardia beijingensis]